MMTMRPELEALYATWNAIHGDGTLPARGEIGPETLKAWLRNVELIDIEREPMRFRRRLVGTKIVDYQGVDRTGDYLASDDAATVDGWALEDYAECAAKGLPVHRQDSGIDANGDTVRWERLLMPLASDGRTPDMILVGLYVDVAQQRPALSRSKPAEHWHRHRPRTQAIYC
jgi:hypothetical protein